MVVAVALLSDAGKRVLSEGLVGASQVSRGELVSIRPVVHVLKGHIATSHFSSSGAVEDSALASAVASFLSALHGWRELGGHALAEAHAVTLVVSSFLERVKWEVLLVALERSERVLALVLEPLEVDHGVSIVQSIVRVRDALSSVERPSEVDVAERTAAVLALIGTLVQGGAELLARRVSCLIEALLLPVVGQPVVAKLTLDLVHDVAVLLHEIVVPSQHAVGLDGGDLGSAVLVPALLSAVFVPVLLQLLFLEFAEVWVSLLVALSLFVSHASLLAETARSHLPAFMHTPMEPVEFGLLGLPAVRAQSHIGIPLQVALGLVVSRHLVLRPVLSDVARAWFDVLHVVHLTFFELLLSPLNAVLD